MLSCIFVVGLCVMFPQCCSRYGVLCQSFGVCNGVFKYALRVTPAVTKLTVYRRYISNGSEEVRASSGGIGICNFWSVFGHGSKSDYHICVKSR